MNALRLMRAAALCVIVFTGASAPLVHAGAGYSFKVHNNTKHTIISLLASEKGETPGKFDIGKGIGPGQSATLEWDKSTDNTNCAWAFTAVYDDGTYSEPVMIDFCQDNLELDFDE